MKKSSPLLRLILLNILISTVTTLAVLWVWERAHPRPETGMMIENAENMLNPTPPLEDSNTNSLTDTGFEFTNEDITINIRTIVGAGNLEVEYVEIINQGENPANLTTWQLIDEGNNAFTFPTLILNSGGAIKIFSKAGTNTVIELYWQSEVPIWQSGETARLLNVDGEVVTSYSIP